MAASGLMPTRQLDNRERAEVVRQAIHGLERAAEDGADAVEVRRHELSGDRAGDGFVHPGGQVAVVAGAVNLRAALEPYMKEGLRPGNEHEEPS